MTDSKPMQFSKAQPNTADIGIVKYHDQVFAEKEPMLLESGAFLGPFTLRYETYGTLNKEKSNAILIEHALSGNHHAAGKYKEDDKTSGWWDMMIGPGKAFDTNKYYIICSNCIGGCSGSTGPNSIDENAGNPYGLSFPVITLGDMVKAQIYLLDFMGIKKLYSVAGGSMGGMMALHLAAHYPEKVRSVITIACTAAQSAQSIAFSEVARQAIIQDPNWDQGKYTEKSGPNAGLAIARMMSHITYLSDKSMRQKFGRRLQNKKELGFTFEVDFQVESYLRHQGQRFIDLFDANSYLYISKAMNYFDLEAEFGTLENAFKNGNSPFLVIAFSSDWLYPPYMNKQLAKGMIRAGRETSYAEIETDHGHDSFLLEADELTQLIEAFINNL